VRVLFIPVARGELLEALAAGKGDIAASSLGVTEERQKFLALIQYFQRYGDKYDVDWLLMAAQGYQESQLNRRRF
jgi:membrane-bound lytic murein transglycosylase MltF